MQPLIFRSSLGNVQELSVTLGMAYLAFYVANSPQVAGTSGVIAVVVMGIYGSATGKWDMSPRVAESGFFYRCVCHSCLFV